MKSQKYEFGSDGYVSELDQILMLCYIGDIIAEEAIRRLGHASATDIADHPEAWTGLPSPATGHTCRALDHIPTHAMGTFEQLSALSEIADEKFPKAMRAIIVVTFVWFAALGYTLSSML